MATFEVLVYKVSIEPHPDADNISIAIIGDYRSVVKKGMYKTGDLVVYIPEAAILPEWVLKNQGFWDNNNQKGMLAGSAGNRVKAARFRGIISQGIVYPIINDKNGNYLSVKDNPDESADFIEVTEGEDVTKYLGIIKYEPPIPTHLSGEVCNLMGYTLSYDIENYKKYPSCIKENDEVIFSEKIHGCVHPNTLIMLPNGEEIPISNIINDKKYTHVWSYDVESKQFMSKTITGRMRRPNTEHKRWVNVILENNRVLKLTEDHPIFSEDRDMYVEAKDILPGENIKSPI